MALITPSITILPDPGTPIAYRVVWGPMANGDTGTPVDLDFHADRTIQVEGTFGPGGNLEVQGSNDGVNFRVLRDPFGVALDIAVASVRQIVEIPGQVRPAVTAGDGTTSLFFTMYIRRTNR